MRSINRHNILPIICITYTAVSISLTIYEILVKKEMNPTQLNIFLFLALSILGVVVLSMHRVLDRFSPLAMILIQYALAVALILGTLKLASYVVDIHPDGYHDMVVSFSIPYAIGALIYYLILYVDARKQNQLLEEIRQKHDNIEIN